MQSSEYSDLIPIAFDVFDQNNDGLIGPEELNAGTAPDVICFRLDIMLLQERKLLLTSANDASYRIFTNCTVIKLKCNFAVVAALANVYPPPTSTEIMELITCVSDNDSGKFNKHDFVRWMKE